MMLLTKENLRQLPPLYAQDGKGKESIAYVKFFHPMSRWTYFVTEYDPDDRIIFGWCVSPLGADCDEFGYSSMSELEDLRVCGLGVERDLDFRPKTIAAALEEQLVATGGRVR